MGDGLTLIYGWSTVAFPLEPSYLVAVYSIGIIWKMEGITLCASTAKADHT